MSNEISWDDGIDEPLDNIASTKAEDDYNYWMEWMRQEHE